MSAKQVDEFWNTDLEDIEASFLGNRKVTDLPIHLDPRVPPQGRVEMDRVVNVDMAVAGYFARHSMPASPKHGTFTRIFDRLIFG